MMRGHSALLRQPGAITAKYATLQSIPVDGWGQQGNGDTSSNFARATFSIILSVDFLLDYIGINFYAVQDYKVAFVDSTESSPADLAVIDAAFSATGSRTFDLVTPSSPIYLSKGTNYISISGASTKITSNTTDVSVTINEYLTLEGAWFAGTYSSSWTAGVVLFGRRVT